MDGNYVTMTVTLVVWVGLFIFLMRLDKRIKELEKRSR
ncbi:MAG: CcmD family protein [Candidatus Zixiibacteriota bacterium]|nr:MAG: CcmD family protein [candidate division Zixibacteria bacterium]